MQHLPWDTLHNGQLANTVVEAGAIFHLVLCLREPELSLKRIAASSLGDIAKHSADLAEEVVNAGAAPFLSQLISHPDSELKRQVCFALAQIAKHTVNLAELVVEQEIFPMILNCLKDTDPHVKKNAATCICEVAKQNDAMARLITNAGGSAAIVDYISETKGNARLPGIMTLGYISAYEEGLAMGVIVSKGVTPLSHALTNEPEDHIKAAAAWALGQIGRHSPDHAKALAEANIPFQLLAAYIDKRSSDDLKARARRALKSIVQMCSQLDVLQPLLEKSPPMILKYVVRQYAKILPTNVEALRTFVQRGGLRKIQEIKAPAGSKLKEYKEQIIKKIEEFNAGS